MYKTSNDRRFKKNKQLIRQAYIDLTLEKGLHQVTVADITRRADVNRMTFYSHYDTIDDVLTEFVDDMVAELIAALDDGTIHNMDGYFEAMNALMYREEDFFRKASMDNASAPLRMSFRTAIRGFFREWDERLGMQQTEKEQIMEDLLSVSIAYAYFDWLSGAYGDASLDFVIETLKEMISKLWHPQGTDLLGGDYYAMRKK